MHQGLMVPVLVLGGKLDISIDKQADIVLMFGDHQLLVRRLFPQDYLVPVKPCSIPDATFPKQHSQQP